MGAQTGIWRREFSNFHVEPDGSFVEWEFQAAKHDGYPIRQAVIKRAKTPWRAKELGREWPLTEDELAAWNNRRVDVMLDLVACKVNEWDYIRKALLATGDQKIVEFNKHHDNFWGDCTCIKCYRIGANWLGETLMLVRRRLLGGGHDEYEMHTIAASHAPISRSR